MLYIKILSVIAFIGSIVWLYFAPGFEPLLAVLGSLSTAITAFLIQKRKSRKAQQRQSVSKSSVGVQAGGNVIITKTGLTYGEVREAALDVYRSNFYELAGVAKEIAGTRAEEITEAFLRKLQIENPAGFDKSSDPDFQHALFTVQKEYARNGDKDLGDLLVDLLVDRSKQGQRDILQIVLNEFLNTAPKLTENQLASLAVIFFFKYTQNNNVENHIIFGEYLDRNVAPFVSKIGKNRACYQHLEYSGCGTIGRNKISLEFILGITYQGLFLKGFDEIMIADKDISIGLDTKFFKPCLNDPTKIQVRANSIELLEKALDEQQIIPEDRTKIIELFNAGKMNDDEIKSICIEIRPYMEELFEVWSVSAMKEFTLTSVGIAIGHANIKRLVGEFSNLSIWIN